MLSHTHFSRSICDLPPQIAPSGLVSLMKHPYHSLLMRHLTWMLSTLGCRSLSQPAGSRAGPLELPWDSSQFINQAGGGI
jgi:hypothetical protein